MPIVCSWVRLLGIKKMYDVNSLVRVVGREAVVDMECRYVVTRDKVIGGQEMFDL